MYGHLFLLKNLPLTDSAPLADYLNLLWELLRQQADQVLPYSSEGPITISIKPRDLALLKDLRPSVGTSVDQSSSCHPHNAHRCQAQRDPPVTASFKDKTLPTTPDSSITAKDEYSCIPLGPTLLRLPCKLSPSSTPHKLLFLIWLSICFPFAAQKSSSCDPCMHIARAGSVVTKTLLFHTSYSCVGSYRVMHSQSHHLSSLFPW
jgi:hypothetical protein